MNASVLVALKAWGAAAIAVWAMTGCAVIHPPNVAYADGKHPVGDTAVLIAWTSVNGGQNQDELARILKVNGAEVSNPPPGVFVRWARVKPGRNVFTISYVTDAVASPSGAGLSIQAKRAVGDLVVEDMKPRHVYIVRYQKTGGTVQFLVEDRGPDSDAGLTVCDANKSCRVVRPTFE